MFVPNRSDHDFSAAERFGELVFITSGELAKYRTTQMLRACEEAMKDSTSKDYILLTSLSTLCSICCTVFGAKHGQLNLLLFTGTRYVKRTVVLKGTNQ